MLQSNFTREHVFVIGEGSILDEGVTHLLTQETKLLVSRAIFSDEPAFLNKIEQDRPDVILVCESGGLAAGRILDIISSLQIVFELRIVVVRLSNNEIDVYGKSFFTGKISSRPQRIIARGGDDLLNALGIKHNSQIESRI